MRGSNRRDEAKAEEDGLTVAVCMFLAAVCILVAALTQ